MAATDRNQSHWVSPDLWDRYKDKFEAGDLVEFHREGMPFHHWGLYLGDGLVVHVSSFNLWNPSAGFTDRFVNASSASRALVRNVSAASTIPGAQAAPADEVVELVELPSGSVQMPTVPVEKAEDVPCGVKCGDIEIKPSPSDLGVALEERTKWFIKVEDIRRIAGRDQFRVNNVVTKAINRVTRTPQEIFQIIKTLKDQEVDYSLISQNCEHFVTSLKFKQDPNEPPDVVPVVINAPHGTSSQVRRVVQMISVGMVTLAGLAGAAVASYLVKKVPAAAASSPSSPPASNKTEEKQKPA